MNTSRPRIGFSEPIFPPEYAFRIPSDRPSLKSANGSAGLRFSRSPVSPNPTPSSPGTGGSLPANLTAPNYVLRRAASASRPNWKRSLCASPERTPAGDSTLSSEPWPISATPFPIRRRAHPAPIRNPAGTHAEPKHHLEGFHRPPHGRPNLYRLLHSRSAHLAGSGHPQRLVF